MNQNEIEAGLVSDFANMWQAFQAIQPPEGIILQEFTHTTNRIYRSITFLETSLPPTSDTLMKAFEAEIEDIRVFYKEHYQKKTYTEVYLETVYLFVRSTHCLIQTDEESYRHNNFRKSPAHIKLINEWYQKTVKQMLKLSKFQPMK